MIPEPKTIRESNIFVAGIEARLGLVQKMVWGVIALLGTLLAGAAALYVQIGDLRTDLAVVKTNVTAINDRVVKMDKSIDEVRADETRIRETLTRIETKHSCSRC
jgi:septation ring formation regulator EzrA